MRFSFFSAAKSNAHMFAFFGCCALACGGTVAPTSSSSSGSSSGGSSSGASSSSSSGSTGSSGSTSGNLPDGGVRVPKKHRASAKACPVDRQSPPVVDPPQGSTCASHAECDKGTNGRCLANGRTGMYTCSYDNCGSDAECTLDGGGKRACNCREEGGVGANSCLQGSCAIDSDCAGGNYCSPSQGTCGLYGGTIGYFCHSAADECVDDSDCPFASQEGTCRFNSQLGHFKCDDSQCAG